MGEGRLTPSLGGRASAAVFPHCWLDDVPGFREKVTKGIYLSARRVVVTGAYQGNPEMAVLYLSGLFS